MNHVTKFQTPQKLRLHKYFIQKYVVKFRETKFQDTEANFNICSYIIIINRSALSSELI